MTIYEHTVGDVRPTLVRIIDSHLSKTAAAEAIGINRPTVSRILHSPDDLGLAKKTYDKIVRHDESLRAGDVKAGASVAAFARTPEGRRFIDLCRDGRVAA